MNIKKQNPFPRAAFLILLLLIQPALKAAGDLLEIQGNYLIYSFDYNYIYGRGNIILKTKQFTIKAGMIELDINDRNALLSEKCTVTFQNQTEQADIVYLNLDTLHLLLRSFNDTIHISRVPEESQEENGKKFIPISMYQLKQSLIYYIGKKFTLKKNYSVYGHKASIFIEGMPSVTFRKFRMDKGVPSEREQPFALEKIWYYPSQGFVVNTSFDYKTKGESPLYTNHTTLQGQYDLFKNLGLDPRGRILFNTDQKLQLAKNFEMTSKVSYITKNMLQGNIRFHHNLGETWSNEWLMDYSKPHMGLEETWMRWNSNLNLKKWGSMQMRYSFEQSQQNTFDLSYQNTLFKKLNLNFSHSVTKLLIQDNEFNRVSRSNFSASYTTKIFDLSGNYSFHRDELQALRQTDPRVQLRITPFTLYDGLLKFNISSSVNITQLKRKEFQDQLFNANTTLNMETVPFQVMPGGELSASFQLEHLHTKDPLNRTVSFGYILRGKQDLGKLWNVEFTYHYNTRREPTHWFVQGTHSQEWNALVRLLEKPESRFSGWSSVSFDSKIGRFTTAFIDLKMSLIKHWHVQTQVNYDFRFERLNYDIYLYRKAGRFTFRFSYRSLTKAPMFEIVAE